MAGGNSHQRKMQKKVEERIQRNVETNIRQGLSVQGLSNDKTPSSSEEKTRLSFLKKAGLDGVSFAFFTGLGFAFLALPYQFEKARWCFIVAAIALIIRVVSSVTVKLYPKLLIAVLGSIAAGFVVNRVNDWVTKLQLVAIASDAPMVRTVVTNKYVSPPTPPPIRSDVVFDGSPYFIPLKDTKGQLLPDQNLTIGQPLAFSFDFKQAGPNPVEVTDISDTLYIEVDHENKTQFRLIEDFKKKLRAKLKTGNPHRQTLTQGQSGFNSPQARDERDQPRLITRADFDAFHAGKEVAFVIAQITYEDK